MQQAQVVGERTKPKRKPALRTDQRRQKDREAARRSRNRKQTLVDSLGEDNLRLKLENDALRKHIYGHGGVVPACPQHRTQQIMRRLIGDLRGMFNPMEDALIHLWTLRMGTVIANRWVQNGKPLPQDLAEQISLSEVHEIITELEDETLLTPTQRSELFNGIEIHSETIERMVEIIKMIRDRAVQMQSLEREYENIWNVTKKSVDKICVSFEPEKGMLFQAWLDKRHSTLRKLAIGSLSDDWSACFLYPSADEEQGSPKENSLCSQGTKRNKRATISREKNNDSDSSRPTSTTTTMAHPVGRSTSSYVPLLSSSSESALTSPSVSSMAIDSLLARPSVGETDSPSLMSNLMTGPFISQPSPLTTQPPPNLSIPLITGSSMSVPFFSSYPLSMPFQNPLSASHSIPTSSSSSTMPLSPPSQTLIPHPQPQPQALSVPKIAQSVLSQQRTQFPPSYNHPSYNHPSSQPLMSSSPQISTPAHNIPLLPPQPSPSPVPVYFPMLANGSSSHPVFTLVSTPQGLILQPVSSDLHARPDVRSSPNENIADNLSSKGSSRSTSDRSTSDGHASNPILQSAPSALNDFNKLGMGLERVESGFGLLSEDWDDFLQGGTDETNAI
mmetsp:Transcript_22330/g.36929  ORF Transcript_22330/g.36929 Transcript_22330/m.36929 type:complete len:616 (+) Transcript_22330:122-1969(+)